MMISAGSVLLVLLLRKLSGLHLDDICPQSCSSDWNSWTPTSLGSWCSDSMCQRSQTFYWTVSVSAVLMTFKKPIVCKLWLNRCKICVTVSFLVHYILSVYSLSFHVFTFNLTFVCRESLNISFSKNISSCSSWPESWRVRWCDSNVSFSESLDRVGLKFGKGWVQIVFWSGFIPESVYQDVDSKSL